MDSIGLKVINASSNSSSLTEGKESHFSGFSYEFEADSLLLGDGGLPVAELRPILAARITKDDIFAFSTINSPTKTPYSDVEFSKERSMKEYADLKVSLLLYDFALVVAGAAILTASSNEVYADSFSAGGVSGFLYLLLLQRSVDGLSVPLSSTENDEVESPMQSYGGLKGPVTSLAFVMAAIVVSSKLWMGGTKMVFSSSELLAGVAGFLTCKIAVVLAALKPIQTSVREDKT